MNRFTTRLGLQLRLLPLLFPLLLLPFFFCSSSAASPVEKRQFLLPSYLFKVNEPKRRIKQSIPEEAMPLMFHQQQAGSSSSSMDVAANVLPIRRGHHQQKEPFAMRPCYFSPIQCLLHTPEHDRKFQNYPEFQQNSYARARDDQSAANLQFGNSPRVKAAAAAAIEAILVQKELEKEKKARASRGSSRRMMRESRVVAAIPQLEEDAAAVRPSNRHRLFGNPWRRGL